MINVSWVVRCMIFLCLRARSPRPDLAPMSPTIHRGFMDEPVLTADTDDCVVGEGRHRGKGRVMDWLTCTDTCEVNKDDNTSYTFQMSTSRTKP